MRFVYWPMRFGYRPMRFVYRPMRFGYRPMRFVYRPMRFGAFVCIFVSVKTVPSGATHRSRWILVQIWRPFQLFSEKLPSSHVPASPASTAMKRCVSTDGTNATVHSMTRISIRYQRQTHRYVFESSTLLGKSDDLICSDPIRFYKGLIIAELFRRSESDGSWK